MKNHEKVFVSPNRINLRFSVKKIQKSLMLSQLDWIVDMVKENGIRTPKTIIFCTTLYGVGSVMNYLMMQLGPFAFYPPSSHERMNCLLGIFHSSTLQKYKEKRLQSFKEPDGLNWLVNYNVFPPIRSVSYRFCTVIT